MIRLWIPGPLPGLNEIIDAKARKRGKWDAYADMKRKWGGTIALLAQAQRLERIPDESVFTYLFIEPNRRRDPSNIVAGGVKLIEDALQEAGVLENDGWKSVAGIRAYWALADVNNGAGFGGVLLNVFPFPVSEEEMLESFRGRGGKVS